MEYCGWGDLAMKIKRYIKRREYIDERVIWVYLIQILEGLKVGHFS
jgi:serine/threonine protein kinase